MEKSELKQETIVRDKAPEPSATIGGEAGTSTMQFRRKIAKEEIPVAQQAYLEVFGMEGGAIGYELGEKEVVIGRNPECDLKLALYGISRAHSRIFFKNEEYCIEDMGSTNGTFVNGIKVLKCVLRNNDQIEIGEARLIFVEERTRG